MNSLVERTIAGLHSHLIGHILAAAPKPPVLDVGCGTGAWLNRLAAAGLTDLHGIDLDVSQFDVPAATCSAANLDHDDLGLTRQYGLITALELVEHLENPGRLFRLVEKHLAHDGLFLMTSPNIMSLAARVRFLVKGSLPSFDEKGDPTHLMPITPTMLERTLPRHSLVLKQIWTYPSSRAVSFGPAVRALTAAAGFLPNRYPGDILCYEIRKA